MLKATQLLEGSSLEVKQVAAQVGYKQLSEFDRHFRRFYGVTPTVWRKRATVRNER